MDDFQGSFNWHNDDFDELYVSSNEEPYSSQSNLHSVYSNIAVEQQATKGYDISDVTNLDMLGGIITSVEKQKKTNKPKPIKSDSVASSFDDIYSSTQPRDIEKVSSKDKRR